MNIDIFKSPGDPLAPDCWYYPWKRKGTANFVESAGFVSLPRLPLLLVFLLSALRIAPKKPKQYALGSWIR